MEVEATVQELQTQLTAVQAAIEGNSQSSIFKPRSFSGLPSEDVNEWLGKFERFSKFYNWSNAKKLGALTLLLEGPALAWYQTLPDEDTGSFANLCTALRDRFGAQNLEFLFRQELYSRKQGLGEPLAVYTEDIIKKCQRLALPDKDIMNIFINGLSDDLKTHVILNQPKTFAEAENLARLKDSVGKTLPPTFSAQTVQDRRIKELEGQVNLLLSLASQKKTQTIQALSTSHADIPHDVFQNFDFDPCMPQNDNRFGNNDPRNLKEEVIAAIQTGFNNLNGNKNWEDSQRRGARGRNLRTTDGQPICNNCQRVGHVARYCRFGQHQQQQFQSARRGGFRGNQNNSSIFFQNREPLNRTGPLQWGQ